MILLLGLDDSVDTLMAIGMVVSAVGVIVLERGKITERLP